MSSETYENKAEFVMSHVGASDRMRDQYVGGWIETVDNFTVSSYGGMRGGGDTSDPFRRGSTRMGGLAMDQIFLKDPETHKAIMTFAAKLVRSILGDPRSEYIQAVPVGWEDAKKVAPTVSRLLRYAFQIHGHFRTMVEGILDMLLFGTGIIEVGYRYDEREMPIRSAMREAGIEYFGETQRMRIPVYDDVDLSIVDVQDFYPDPGQYRIDRMRGAAKRFRIGKTEIKELIKRGRYFASAEDLTGPGYTASSSHGDRFREGIDQPIAAKRLDAFGEMIGYEYWGDVPWIEDDGTSRRTLAVVNGELVRDEAWGISDPELPWKTLVINPLAGRFYGISPAEVIRYDQDFADVLKELIARAIIRQVHPPIAFDPDSDIEPEMLRRWRTDMPIAAKGGANSVATLRYDANIQGALNVLGMTKLAMQEASGAQGGIQGEPGPDREAATVGTLRIQAAMDRPELAAMMLERDAMPAIGRAILRRYQQFLSGTDDLKRRIGELPEGIWIGDILAEFDVQFVGSRMAMSRQMKLQAYDRLISMASAVPPFQNMIPWDKVAQELIGNVLELPEVAADIGNPQVMQLNALLSMLQGGGGAQNNQLPTASEPPGLAPAQAAGGLDELA